MEFSKIIAVSGKPGLYKILSQTKKGVVVQSLLDGKRTAINAAQNVSLLENIAIYTYETEIPLGEILKTISKKESGKETISHKASNDELTAYFLEILPNYDAERVYPSNIKKVVQWYNILVDSKFDFAFLGKEVASQEEE